MYPADLKYTKDHEWVQLDGDDGARRHHRLRAEAARRRRLPRAAGGRPHAEARATSFGTIESVKAVSELYAPVSGEVVEVNAALEREARSRQHAIRTSSWMIAIKLTTPATRRSARRRRSTPI